MKRGDSSHHITETVDRACLWHALTPQMFPVTLLYNALSQALAAGASITDEASAVEWLGLTPKLVAGRSDNLKVTQPEDLALAEFYLSRELNNKEQ
jgi:2-C-methyl-D-erythritol 4-phosphate cytidylyltransferase